MDLPTALFVRQNDICQKITDEQITNAAVESTKSQWGHGGQDTKCSQENVGQGTEIPNDGNGQRLNVQHRICNNVNHRDSPSTFWGR